MKLTSSAFQEGGIIPSRFTCEGANINPPLEISAVPENTKSLVLIMDDPDVPPQVRPDRMWVHWVLYNIEPDTRQIAEAGEHPGIAGKTTYGHHKYGGPCPPDAEHRYFFKLYALDCKLLNLAEDAGKKEIELAMHSHIIAEAVLLGRYEKGKGY
jgi:Raf kinase inhibitor-like YbhB/YbcL family protein